MQSIKPFFSDYSAGFMAHTTVLSQVIHPLRDAPLTEQANAQFEDACSAIKKGHSASMGLFGPAGTGKTLLLANLAHRLKLPIIFVDKGFFDTLSKSNLSALFAHGEKHKGILFFDEADALFLGKVTYENGEKLDPNLALKLIEQRQAATVLSFSSADVLQKSQWRLKFSIEVR